LASTVTGAPQRNANGQLLPGHQIGTSTQFKAGNRAASGPRVSSTAAYWHSVMMSAVSDEDMIAITQTLVQAAKERDWVALRIILLYLIGKPAGCLETDLYAREAEAQQTKKPSLFQRASPEGKGEPSLVERVEQLAALFERAEVNAAAKH
jgi:hypothetical protein